MSRGNNCNRITNLGKNVILLLLVSQILCPKLDFFKVEPSDSCRDYKLSFFYLFYVKDKSNFEQACELSFDGI